MAGGGLCPVGDGVTLRDAVRHTASRISTLLSALLHINIPVSTRRNLMFLREIIHIQRHGNIQQAVQIHHRLAFRHIAEACDIRHFPCVFLLGTFGNGHTQRVVEFDSCLIQQLVADIASDVAVLNIENRDIALHFTFCCFGFLIRKFDNFCRKLWPHLFERNRPGSQTRTGVGIHITTVEGI